MSKPTFKPVRADRDSGEIRLLDKEYWDERLVPYAGQELMAAYNPDNLLRTIGVYEFDGKFICIASRVSSALTILRIRIE